MRVYIVAMEEELAYLTVILVISALSTENTHIHTYPSYMPTYNSRGVRSP